MSTPGDSLDVADVMQRATAALAKGEAVQARDLLDRVIAAKRADASVWLSMAHARGLLGDMTGKALAIDQALTAAPRDLRALLAKADHLFESGDARGASAYYTAALQHLPHFNALPAQLQQGLRRAEAALAQLVRDLEDHVRGYLETSGVKPEKAPARFRNAVDILFDKKRPYVQEPRYLYYPELPQIQFYEREQFGWLDAVEAAAADVREELQAVIGVEFTPYITQSANRPKSSQRGLTDNLDWSAYFLRKDSADQPGAARCPRTMAALAGAPLTQIPNRAPSILFSKLAAGAHIPPHTGMINARLICHLPLIVPPGCEFRVGNDVRMWEQGKCWVFDDTIEHEAWNKSDQTRVILIFDVWNPLLTPAERDLIETMMAALNEYGDAAAYSPR